MEREKVVPDVIDKVPPEVVRVSYPSGVAVDLGKELTPTQVKDEPTVSWKADAGAFYTLIMTDADPSDLSLRDICHWIVVNIPGSEVNKGEVLASYIGSGPTEGTGLHRYIFLVYRQSGKQSFDDNLKSKFRVREGRLRFSSRKFAAENKLGDPVAGNFYRAEYDDYVPILHAKLAQMK